MGAALRHLRLRHGWSQQALADLAGVDRKTVNRAEAGHGDLSMTRLWLLADSLMVSLTEIIELAEASEPTATRVPAEAG